MSVAALEAQLAEHGQCLAFEPPHFGPARPSAAWSRPACRGPARARAGSLRDHLLGVSLLSGSGELMHFGGKVIKNVAGYDVSRVIAGSLGTSASSSRPRSRCCRRRKPRRRCAST